jgi:hypothetical protein
MAEVKPPVRTLQTLHLTTHRHVETPGKARRSSLRAANSVVPPGACR